MLEKIKFTSVQDEVLILPLYDPTEGLFIEKIDGLDPVKATLVSSGYATLDGAKYHTGRREPRNIVIQLGLETQNISESVFDIRSRLYKVFMPKTEVHMTFYDNYGKLTVDIVGYVETFESDLFAKDPTAAISIMCFDPDFYNPTPVVHRGRTADNSDEIEIDYEGTVDTGLLFSLQLYAPMPEFTIFHRTNNSRVRLNVMLFNQPLLGGDLLEINTVSGSKFVMRTRGGDRTSVIYGISPSSDWLELQPGKNYIRVLAQPYEQPFSITYTRKYGGL